jgi:peptidoglycan/xylan/chitin deacetylase (PgdA/CDA1 family)
MVLFNCRILTRGNKSGNAFSVTFDDGPHPGLTPKLQKILEKHRAKATFFLSGRNLENNISEAEEIARHGHLLGNHTYSHLSALCTRKTRLQDEVVRTKDLIETVTGEPNHFLRPPYGHISPALLSICNELDLSIVLWNFNSWDFRGISAERIVNRAERKISPGTILLFHECHFRDGSRDYTATVEAVDSILEYALGRGLKPVTVAELLDDQRVMK